MQPRMEGELTHQADGKRQGWWAWRVGAERALPSGLQLTRTLPPRSLAQALFTVLSQVLCFLAIEWYLPLLVSSLVLGWLNLLYYTRGFQHTGIYSVMIQKVSGGGGPMAAAPGRAGQHTPVGLLWALAGRRLGRGEHEHVSACVSCTQTLREYECAHSCSQGSVLYTHKQTPARVCLQVPTWEPHASLHTEGAETMQAPLCACAPRHLGIWVCLHLFI